MNASPIDWSAYDRDPEYRKHVYNNRAVYGGACPGAGVIGGRLIKGSKEAKARMAYLRSLRGKPGRHLKAGKVFGKMSPRLRDWYRNSDPLGGFYEQLQQQNRIKGGEGLDGGVGDLIQAGVGNWVDWGKAYKAERDAQIDDIKRLESLRNERKRNPKLSRNDIVARYNKGRKTQAASDDFFGRLNNGTAGNVLRGPAGWIRLIGRKARQNKIDALKRELGI